MTTTTTDTAHSFTLDELQAYDEGALAPERAAVVGRHLAAGCPACRAWIAHSSEGGHLLGRGEGIHAALAALGAAADAWGTPDTPYTRARRWLRRRLRPRRFAVLLVVLPLKGRLVRHLFRSSQRWETRVSALISLLALTLAACRFVCAAPPWPSGATATAPRRASQPREDPGAHRSEV